MIFFCEKNAVVYIWLSTNITIWMWWMMIIRIRMRVAIKFGYRHLVFNLMFIDTQNYFFFFIDISNVTGKKFINKLSIVLIDFFCKRKCHEYNRICMPCFTKDAWRLTNSIIPSHKSFFIYFRGIHMWWTWWSSYHGWYMETEFENLWMDKIIDFFTSTSVLSLCWCYSSKKDYNFIIDQYLRKS